MLLIKRYLPLCLANMLCVEDLQIAPLFEKADSLELYDKTKKFFFYTRKSTFENVCEMMGTYNLASWFVVLPEYHWQKNLTKYLSPKTLDPKQSL